MITGSLVAVVTPMFADGTLDFSALRRLIDWHVLEGTDAMVIVGTSGESPTITMSEHCELIRVAIEHAAGRIPIVAGTGANSTAEAIELSTFAKKAGATMSLSVVPYYNKPTQEGIYRHFKAVAEAVDLPMILYNVPGRTVADMTNDTVLRLAEIPNIIGIKDATGNLERAADLIMRAPQGFALYSGDDMTAASSILLGYKGNVSVTANVAPRLVHELCMAALAGDVAKTREIHFKLFLLNRDLFCEANPIPIKWALNKRGKIDAGIRLPLTLLSEAGQSKIVAALQSAGL